MAKLQYALKVRHNCFVLTVCSESNNNCEHFSRANFENSQTLLTKTVNYKDISTLTFSVTDFSRGFSIN